MADMADVIAIIFIFFYILCKFYHIDTAVDATIAMIIAFYFGSKHKNTNRK